MSGNNDGDGSQEEVLSNLMLRTVAVLSLLTDTNLELCH